MSRHLPSHTRPSSTNPQTSALQTRINDKKLELESLRQLRDLSAGLAEQMQQLEEKLNTLSDGTEAVGAVMGNWGNVLRAVGMASGMYFPGMESWGEKGSTNVGGCADVFACSCDSETEGCRRGGRGEEAAADVGQDSDPAGGGGAERAGG